LRPVSEIRDPSNTEYGMAAILTYAAVYFMSWLMTKYPGEKWVILLAYPVYFFSAFYPAYLLSNRVKHPHLLIGFKAGIYGWAFSGFSLWVLTGTTSLIFLTILLICMVPGGLTGAYLAFRRRIRKKALS